MDVLVQHGLQVSRRTVVEELSPVGSLVPGVLTSDQSHRFREVEQGPETPGDSGRAVTGREGRPSFRVRYTCQGPEGARRGPRHRYRSKNLRQIRRWPSKSQRSVDQLLCIPDMIHPPRALVFILLRPAPKARELPATEPLSGGLGVPREVEKHRGRPVPDLVLALGVEIRLGKFAKRGFESRPDAG